MLTPRRSILFVVAALILAGAPRESAAQSTDAAALDSAALQRLVQAAEAAHSDALVVWRDGKKVGAWYFGKQPMKIEAMSVTKSIVSLAVGRLVATGAIASIDDPVHKYYPAWKQGRKKDITIRHLLTHTSGLQDLPSTSAEVESSPDLVQLALAAELSDPPGKRFFYSNKAVNLLPGIVQQAAGKRMDDFLREDLFATLGITDFGWTRDKAGNPNGYAGFQVYPEDLAKLGQLLLDRGAWNGRQLISAQWFDEIDRSSPIEARAGLLWWLIPERRSWIIDDTHLRALADAGVDSTFLRKAEAIRGRYDSVAEYAAALQRTFGNRYWEPMSAALGPVRMTIARNEYGRMIGYEANGYLGQYVVVYPADRIVAVRMIARSDRYNVATDSFEQFGAMTRALAGRPQ
jgi:CubicO group peptidase (beta-lactamase class C family)